MKKVLMLVLLCCGTVLNAQTVQYGIFVNGTNLLVKAKSTDPFTTSNYLTDVLFTIRWDTAYGVSLGTTSGTYSVVKTGSEGAFTSYKYQTFVLNGGTPILLPENWVAGNEYTLLTVPVNQTAPGTGTFELAPNGFAGLQNPNIAIDLNDIINTSTPYYQSSATGVPLPIQLASFTAVAVNQNQVRLNWTTLSETNNYGFEVQKSKDGKTDYQTIPNSFVAGHQTSLQAHSYTFTDATASSGMWYYRLKQIDLDGGVHYSDAVKAEQVNGVKDKPLPTVFALNQNYPNPFNPSTIIEFALPKESRVTLEVYNLLGQRVATLVDETRPVGYYAVTFDAARLASGLYFYRLSTPQVSFLKKMAVVK
jgi:hypothetical protein